MLYNDGNNASQFVTNCLFDETYAQWRYETTDRLIASLWADTRDSLSYKFSNSPERLVQFSPITFAVHRCPVSTATLRNFRNTINTLLSTFAEPRWLPSSHIAASMLYEDNDEEKEKEEEEEEKDTSKQITNDQCHVTNTNFTLSNNEWQMLHILYKWLQSPGHDKNQDGQLETRAVSTEVVDARRRLFDTMCLDVLRHTVSPNCNREIATSAVRNARVRDEFAKTMTDLHLNATPSPAALTTNDDNGERIISQRISSTVTQSHIDSRNDENESKGINEGECKHRERDVTHSHENANFRTMLTPRAQNLRDANITRTGVSERADFNAMNQRRNSVSTDSAIAAIAWNLHRAPGGDSANAGL